MDGADPPRAICYHAVGAPGGLEVVPFLDDTARRVHDVRSDRRFDVS
jgi:hypothetical protein